MVGGLPVGLQNGGEGKDFVEGGVVGFWKECCHEVASLPMDFEGGVDGLECAEEGSVGFGKECRHVIRGGKNQSVPALFEDSEISVTLSGQTG